MVLRIMKFFLTTVLGLLLCAPMIAQEAAVQQAAKNSSLSGILTKYGSGEPIRNAEISLSRAPEGAQRTVAADEEETTATPDQITAVTDPSGRFRFPSLLPGQYTLVVRKNGFHGFRGPNSRTWQEFLNVTLAPGQSIADLALAMQPGSVVTGKVSDEDGEPMAYVQVSALKWVYANHQRQLRPIGMATTDDQGNYRMFGLEPGRYLIRASVSAEGASSKLHYATAYFPETNSPSEASPIAVRPGDQVQADFRMMRVPAVKVSGRVNGGTAGAQVQVYLRNLRDEAASLVRASGATVDKNGSFILEGVLPGDYMVTALEFRGDGSDNPLHGEAPVHIEGADVSNISLTLDESGKASLQGKLRIDGANITHPRLDTLRIGLLPADDSTGGREFIGNGGYAAIGGDGTIRLDKISPGKYVISLTAEGSGWEDFYTKSVQVGSRDVTDSAVNFNANRGVVPIAVTVGIDGAYVEGTVTDDDGKPVAGATVIGVPEPALRSQFDLFQRAESDQNGHFRLRGIKPGAYSFFAWATMEDESYMDPEFLRGYESLGVNLALAPKDHQKIDLKLLPENE